MPWLIPIILGGLLAYKTVSDETQSMAPHLVALGALGLAAFMAWRCAR